MQKRYMVLAAVGGSVAWIASGSGGSTKTALEFTKQALPAPTAIDLRANLSAAYLAVPVEIGPLARRAEQALPEKLAVVHDLLSEAACARRTQGIECNTAKLEGSVTRNGPVEMQIGARAVTLVVPIKYDLAATGLGWTSHLTERKTGETRLQLNFPVSVGPTGGLDVSFRDESAPDETTLTLLKATIKLPRLIDQRLKPVIKAAEDDLRRTLAALPIKAATAHAWSVLAQPLELGQGSGLWLKAAPEYFTAGRFATEQGRLFYRVAIASRMTIQEAERGQSNSSKRQPILAQDTTASPQSSVRLAVPIDLEAMRQIAEATFAKGEVLESQADRFSEPVKVKVLDTRVYPAMRQIGLELDVEVTTRKGVKYTGKLNLAGRPVLDAATGTVTLADVTFPPVASKDASTKDAATNTKAPRLGSEPFAGKFAAAAKLDVSRALSEALPRATHMLNQRVGEDLVLTTKLERAVPVSLEMARDGAWLLVDLTGEVVLQYDGAADQAAATNAKAEDSKEPRPAATAAAGAVIAGGAVAASVLATAKPAAEVRRPVPAKKPVEKRSHETKPEPRHDTKKAAEHKTKPAHPQSRT